MIVVELKEPQIPFRKEIKCLHVLNSILKHRSNMAIGLNGIMNVCQWIELPVYSSPNQSIRIQN